jgi:hypothetical protein
MNEKIKELARQADLPLIHGNFLTVAQEKFAELIVAECAGIGYDASYYECALNVSSKIKQHFGVEE